MRKMLICPFHETAANNPPGNAETDLKTSGAKVFIVMTLDVIPTLSARGM